MDKELTPTQTKTSMSDGGNSAKKVGKDPTFITTITLN